MDEATKQQIEQKRALMGLLGHTYAQMKEIDTHIAAAGSSAKFAGRSEDLKRQFENIASAPVVAPLPTINPGLEMEPASFPSQPFVAQPIAPQPLFVPPAMEYAAPAPAPAPAAVDKDVQQLEFNFKQVEKNVLNDIYNVLYDIKKILLESKKNQPAPKKKMQECILCGSKATVNALPQGYEVRCTSCNAATTQKHATAKEAVKEWNKDNQ